jgi:hypothetical protein
MGAGMTLQELIDFYDRACSNFLVLNAFGLIGKRSRARSSAEEHYVDIVGVTGSIPVAPTIQFIEFKMFSAQALPTGRRSALSGKHRGSRSSHFGEPAVAFNGDPSHIPLGFIFRRERLVACRGRAILRFLRPTTSK